jgi:hypothetical protein
MKRRLETEAAEALRETLSHLSVIKVIAIDAEQTVGGEKALIARVDIFGHLHVLVCKVAQNCDVSHLRQTLIELKELMTLVPGETTPVLIAPALSVEAQSLCSDASTGFLDLEGNARLYLDEVFIVKRSLPNGKKLPSRAEPMPTSETARFAHA